MNAKRLSVFAIVFLVSAAVCAQQYADPEADRISPQSLQDQFAQPHWDYFIYPVPAVDELHVQVTKGRMAIRSVRIIDPSGKPVLKVEDFDSDHARIDITGIPDGRYFIQIIPDDNQSAKMKRLYVSR